MKYEDYKDSGMSWIGQVPTQWKRSRLKFLFSHSNAGVWGEEEKGDENDIACFRVADFDYQKGYLGFDKLTMRNITAKELEGRLLSQGSLLIEKSGGGDATPVGRVVRFNYEDKATCSNFVHFVTVDESHNSDFLYYYFYAMYANKENLLYFNQTTGIQNLKVGEYLGQSIFIPTYEEQQAIASYLDKKCGKINGAIDVQKKKIDLLNELKQTIITNAVTKGLNPDAPMKDSGVEWIGQVPEHWEVCKLKYILKLINGRAYSQNELLDDGKYKVLRVGNFFTNEQWYFSDLELEADKYCHSGDLLYAWSASFGPKIWNEDNTIFHYHIWKVNIAKTYDKMYAFYILAALSDFKRGDVHGSTMVHLTMDNMNNSFLTIPSFPEQKSIVKYIEKELSILDSQITKANQRIELLNELKQSIITEAVTGKIKVN